jgi:predicted adenine nucleotide alpha hydrolase (AANH) superfamily ATPase
MQKLNYNNEMKKIIKSFNGSRPKLLLHACCGPCSSAVLERLNEIFDISVLFYNPNIDSEEEYNFRLSELRRLIEEMDLEIRTIDPDYNAEEFYQAVKGHEADREGGARCSICFKLRLDKTAAYAKENGFDFFTTTLSISPYKNSQVLNKIGGLCAKNHGVDYLFSDFKKENGYKRSIELSKDYHLYRQDYCGCSFSKMERLESL